MKALCVAWVVLLGVPSSLACDLCAIYSADNAVVGFEGGFSLTLSEAYIPYRTTQVEGEEVDVNNPSYVDSSITHIVPAYNFTERFGLSLNIPIKALNFRRTDIRYSLSAPPVVFTEQEGEVGLGDAAFIGRFTLFSKREMEYGVLVNLLAGVKFPTGATDRLEDEVEQAEIFDALLPPGTPHDPLEHSISSVHQHNLSFGSGSYDGIFGLTVNSRWQRWFFNAQFQYYLRTEGESGFEYGDEIMVSGGPGAYLWFTKEFTLSLQANAGYDRMAKDELLGKKSDSTGLTAWYLGPTVYFTWGSQLSVNLGIDIPLEIDNNGFQSVPDYRVHGGISWRF